MVAHLSFLYQDLYTFLLYYLLSNVFNAQSDKASMLDEAIEYLKSLQLQLQVSTSLLLLVI